MNDLPIAQAVLKDLELHGVLHGIDRYDQTVRLAERGTLALRAMVDQVFPYTDAQQAFDQLLTQGRPKPKILLRFTDSDQ